MIWRLFVLCKNPQCGIPRKQIRLPYSAPVEGNASVPPLPKDMFPARAVCRECETWSIYTAEDQEWAKIQELPPKPAAAVGPQAWTLKIKCGRPNCTSVTKWHVVDDAGLEGRELARLVFRAKPEIVCEQGHSLLTTDAEVIFLNHD